MSAMIDLCSTGETGRIQISGVTLFWVSAEDADAVRDRLAGEVAARLGLSREEVRVVSRPKMKPSVEIAGRESRGWQASLSYTTGRVMGALVLGRGVGVDVEWVDPAFAWEPIAEEFFPEAVSAWSRLPAERARREFFQRWVRWEAVLKCHGLGFAAPRLLPMESEPGMQVNNLDLGPAYVGALATRAISLG